MYGVVEDGAYVESYDKNTKELDITFTVPAAAGNIKIILYPGAGPSVNNYPFEISAHHNYYVVERPQTILSTIVTPRQTLIKSELATVNSEYTREVPYHDFNPYSGVSLWRMDQYDPDPPAYTRTGIWYPSNKLLLELITYEMVRFNQYVSGFDFNFLPGKSIEFINLFAGDLLDEGSDHYYLPVYEETDLLADDQKICCASARTKK